MKFSSLKRTAAMLALLCVFAAGCASCNRGDKDSASDSSGYKDVIERPELEMPEITPHVSYPQKPSTPPAAGTGTAPTIKAYTASAADSPYKIETSGGKISLSFTEVSDWAYIYAEVEGYSPEFDNIKLTIDNVDAERISIQAVYYEAYDLGYSPVTVYAGELGEGEQYVISELGSFRTIDGLYQATDEFVGDKTIIGFAIFIDSLPCYPATDKSGEASILAFEFLRDGDPALEDRYVKPVADLGSATADSGITLDKGDLLKASGSGTVYIPLDKYTPDYASYNVTLKGAAGDTVGLAVRYNGGVSEPLQVTLTGGSDTATYTFDSLRPTSGGDDTISRFVKYLGVTDIAITANGNVEISDITFNRTAADGCYVSSAWASSSADITIARADDGGNAKVVYSYYTAWNSFSVPVRKGENVGKIRITLYAPEGLDHLGIGIINTSPNHSEGQPSAGTFILRGSVLKVNGGQTELAGNGGKLTESTLLGIVETVEHDAATNTYTLTYDFTAMNEDANGKTFADYTLTSLIFYLNCQCKGEDAAAHTFDGERNLYFVSIELLAD